MNDKLNKLVEAIIYSPIIAYEQIYKFHSFDNFYNLIKSVSEKEKISDYEIIIGMETFAHVYELFRPQKIERHDYYWGSVKTIDAIFTTVYRFLGTDNFRTFNKSFGYTEYGKLEKIPFEEILWDRLLEDIEWIISVVKKTIGREALRLYFISDKIFLGLEYKIKDYIRLEKNNNDLSIEFSEKPYRKITIEGREIFVDKSQSLYSLESELFYGLIQ